MHLPKTKNTEAVFPYVDFDGDGLVDGTKGPYDAEAAAKSRKYSNGVLTRASNLQTWLTVDFYYSDTYNGTLSQSATMFLRKIVYNYPNYVDRKIKVTNGA